MLIANFLLKVAIVLRIHRLTRLTLRPAQSTEAAGNNDSSADIPFILKGRLVNVPFTRREVVRVRTDVMLNDGERAGPRVHPYIQ